MLGRKTQEGWFQEGPGSQGRPGETLRQRDRQTEKIGKTDPQGLPGGADKPRAWCSSQESRSSQDPLSARLAHLVARRHHTPGLSPTGKAALCCLLPRKESKPRMRGELSQAALSRSVPATTVSRLAQPCRSLWPSMAERPRELEEPPRPGLEGLL